MTIHLKWLKNKIQNVLSSLIDLRNLKEKNSSIKALAYQLYENNGVLQRNQVTDYLKILGQNERKFLRDQGVKFGRYHVFLHKLIKPEAVSLRTLLWKNYHQKYFNLKPPVFGLNFLENDKIKNRNFMLLCGFEKFDNFYVRIDILERLFVQIINSNTINLFKNKITFGDFKLNDIPRDAEYIPYIIVMLYLYGHTFMELEI